MTESERRTLYNRRRLLGVSRDRLASMIPSRIGCGRRLNGQSIFFFEHGQREPHPSTLSAWRAALDMLEANPHA